jgi:hypothetical protein
MPRTKPQPAAPSTAAQQTAPATPSPANSDDVLTLAEVAAYLRVPEADVLGMISQDFPGRLVGNEWRFLKSAVRDWLAKSPPKPSKEAILSVAGVWKDDPDLEEMLKEIYKQRGRPMTEDGE